jgi:hypothetical protein
MKTNTFIKKLAVYCVMISCVFVGHAWLQETYHMRCRSNLFKVLAYRNSDACLAMLAVLEQSEMVVRSITNTYTSPLGFVF